MKKFLTALLCAATAAVSVFGLAACNNQSIDSVTFYMPDGAPALAAAQLMAEKQEISDTTIEYRVVDSSAITTYVTYTDESKNADFCILPVNAAAKTLGSSDTYQLVGTVTHGNLYIVSAIYSDALTTDTLSTLVGKSVGVVNLTNVPGLTFKAILTDNSITYGTVDNSGSTSETQVNLYNINSDDLAQTLSTNIYDYYVVPEPAATAQTKRLSLNRVGDLQELYGGDNGYPQAVLVAKKSIIESDEALVTAVCEALTDNETWITTADTTTIVDAINNYVTEGTTSSLNANNLNSTVITNCAIKFVSATESHDAIVSYLTKIGFAVPADSFFYNYAV